MQNLGTYAHVYTYMRICIYSCTAAAQSTIYAYAHTRTQSHVYALPQRRVWRGRTPLQSLLDLPPDLLTETTSLRMQQQMQQQQQTQQQLNSASAPTSNLQGLPASSNSYPTTVNSNASAGSTAADAAGGGLSSVVFICPDNALRWQKMLFRGIEWDLCILDILVGAAARACVNSV